MGNSLRVNKVRKLELADLNVFNYKVLTLDIPWDYKVFYEENNKVNYYDLRKYGAVCSEFDLLPDKSILLIPTIDYIKKYFPITFEKVLNIYDNNLGYIRQGIVCYSKMRFIHRFNKKYSNKIDLNEIKDDYCFFYSKIISKEEKLSETITKEFEDYQCKLRDLYKIQKKPVNKEEEILEKYRNKKNIPDSKEDEEGFVKNNSEGYMRIKKD